MATPYRFDSGPRHQQNFDSEILPDISNEVARRVLSIFNEMLVKKLQTLIVVQSINYHLSSRSGAVAARWAHNPKAVGSNPASATMYTTFKYEYL